MNLIQLRKLPFYNNELSARDTKEQLSSRVIYRSSNVFLPNTLTNRPTFGIHTEQIFALRPHRLAWPRTSAFHAENRGSNPRGDAMQKFASFDQQHRSCSGPALTLRV